MPTTAILTSGLEDVTNQRVEVDEGNRVNIICSGGSNPTWKKGTGNTATSLPSGVTQNNDSTVSLLIITSLTPAKTGVYACHIGASTVETVTVGEFLIIML